MKKDVTYVRIDDRVLSIESSLDLIAGLVFEIQHGDMLFLIMDFILYKIKLTIIDTKMKFNAF